MDSSSSWRPRLCRRAVLSRPGNHAERDRADGPRPQDRRRRADVGVVPVTRGHENVAAVGDCDRDPRVPGLIHVIGYVLLDPGLIELADRRCLRRLRRQQGHGHHQQGCSE